MVPLLVVVVTAAHDHLFRHPASGGVQQVALAARHAERGEHGHVPVATLFAQQRHRVPQPGDGFVRPVQRRIRREQRPTVEWRAACGFFGQFRRGDGVVIGHAVAAKRRHCRFLAGAQRVRRRGDVPCRRERLRDAFGGEVVERGGDNRRRHHPERGGPSGEVAHPKSAKSQPVEGGSGLGSEVGDGVHRFEAIKEAARKRRLSAHFCS